MTARLLPCGEAAVLVEAEPGRLAALVDALGDGALPGVVEVVPAARTALVRFASARELASRRRELTGLLDALPDREPAPDPGRTVTVEVVYGGPDLTEVGELTGLGAEGVVAAHTAAPWRVAFGGFAPGFAYLTGGDPRLAVPRRAEPRPLVPAGAVALAGGFSGIYPRPSPGGWRLIGRTSAVLWDADRQPPALLRPGWWVQFVAVAG